MAVRVARKHRSGHAQRGLRKPNRACRDEAVARRACRVGVKRRLPVYEIVRMLVRGHGTAVARREIFEQLDSRPRAGAQRGDAQVGAEHGVEVLLFRAPVLARSGDAQPQRIAIIGRDLTPSLDEDLPEVRVAHRVVGVERQGGPEEAGRLVEAAARLEDNAQVDHRGGKGGAESERVPGACFERADQP